MLECGVTQEDSHDMGFVPRGVARGDDTLPVDLPRRVLPNIVWIDRAREPHLELGLHPLLVEECIRDAEERKRRRLELVDPGRGWNLGSFARVDRGERHSIAGRRQKAVRRDELERRIAREAHLPRRRGLDLEHGVVAHGARPILDHVARELHGDAAGNHTGEAHGLHHREQHLRGDRLRVDRSGVEFRDRRSVVSSFPRRFLFGVFSTSVAGDEELGREKRDAENRSELESSHERPVQGRSRRRAVPMTDRFTSIYCQEVRHAASPVFRWFGKRNFGADSFCVPVVCNDDASARYSTFPYILRRAPSSRPAGPSRQTSGSM